MIRNMPAKPHFEIEADARARAWLAAHPSADPLVISYDVHRCCGGGRICDVQVRQRSGREGGGRYAAAVTSDGTEIAIDSRAAARLPSRFRLTVSGLGPFKHLDLD